MLIPLEFQPQFKLAASVIAARDIIRRRQSTLSWQVKLSRAKCDEKPNYGRISDRRGLARVCGVLLSAPLIRVNKFDEVLKGGIITV